MNDVTVLRTQHAEPKFMHNVLNMFSNVSYCLFVGQEICFYFFNRFNLILYTWTTTIFVTILSKFNVSSLASIHMFKLAKTSFPVNFRVFSQF